MIGYPNLLLMLYLAPMGLASTAKPTLPPTITVSPEIVSPPRDRIFHHSLPLRVCILVEPSPLTYVSGYANRFQALLSHLCERDDTVEIVTTEVVAVDPPSVWSGFPVHYTPGVRLPYYPLMSLGTDWKFKAASVIRKMKPDVIHASSPGFMVLGGLLWSRIFSTPIVMSYHTHLPVYVRSYVKPVFLGRLAEWLVWILIRVVHSFADVTLVTSPQLLEEFQQHNVPNCRLWQKGIDTERFHPQFRNSTMRNLMTNGHPDDFLLVYVGRLGSEKRLKDLRAVIDRLPTNVRLCFVGTGPQEEELKTCFSHVRDRCVFTGLLEGEQLSQSFASADVFLMPSDSETLGFVVLESMASGVPVIGVKAGGVQDLIDDGVTGYLIEPGDTNGFVDCIQKLQHDEQLRAGMSLRGRIEMERWSWPDSMTKLRNEHYLEALENFHHRLEQCLWRFITLRWWGFPFATKELTAKTIL